MNYPRIGIGVIIYQGQKILLGKRQNSHGASTWSPPGGHLEFGEDLVDCARREVFEETGIEITDAQFTAITNDVFTAENKHYVTLFFSAAYPANQPIQNNEPEKCAGWEWFDVHALPENLFLPLKNLLTHYDTEVITNRMESHEPA